MSQDKILNGKVILITGSTTGIGEAISRAALAQGAKVMIHGRRENIAKAAVENLQTEDAAYVLGDIAKPSVCKHIVEQTIKHFGTIDGIVNNAALMTRSDINTENLDELFNQQLNVNLRAPLLISQTAINYWRKNKRSGNIVNIGSINAHCGQSDLLVYSISKGGLMTQTRNLADALGPERIRVNQLNVGWTLTKNEIELKRQEGLPDDWPSKVPLQFAPTGTLLKPEEVARHVIFWISDYSAPASGAVFDVEQYPMRGRNWIDRQVKL